MGICKAYQISELDKAALWTFTQKELLDQFREGAARFGLLWLATIVGRQIGKHAWPAHLDDRL